MIKLSGRIIALERRARIAADNKGKQDEVQAQAPLDTTETDSEIVAAVEGADSDVPELEEAV